MGETTVVEIITTGLTAVSNDIMAALAAVAPIALGIAGAFLAIRYGMRFFKAISK